MVACRVGFFNAISLFCSMLIFGGLEDYGAMTTYSTNFRVSGTSLVFAIKVFSYNFQLSNFEKPP